MDETLKLARELSKEHDKFTISILVIIIAIYLIINLIIPIMLNFFGRRGEIKKIRSERRLDCSENVIRRLRLLSMALSITDQENIAEGQTEINKLRLYIRSNKLLLPKGLIDLSNSLLDYYSEVLVSSDQRSINTEKDFL